MQPFSNSDLATLQELNKAVDTSKLGTAQNAAVDELITQQQAERAGIPIIMNPQVFNALPEAQRAGRIFAYLLEEPRPKVAQPPLAPPTPNSVAKQKLKSFSPKDAAGTKNLIKTLESKQFGFAQNSALDSLLQPTKPAKANTPPPGQEANTPAGQGNKPAFTFLVNPQALDLSRRAVYSDAITAATSTPSQQYYYTTGREMKISGVLMEVWFLRKSLRPILEQLQLLLVPDIPNESLAPKVLSFCWGAQRFGPCVLTDLNWKEKSWLNGEPATIELSMVLKEIPPPDGDMVSRWVGEKKKITGLGEGQGQTQSGGGESEAKSTKGKKEKQGKAKKQPILTDRQQQDASKQAEQWLQANRTTLDPQVQQRLLSNNYQLQVDGNTGRVTMLNGIGGEKLGTVGNWDGQQFDTSKNSIKKAPKGKKKRGN